MVIAVSTPPPAPRSQVEIVSFAPGEVSCAGGTVSNGGLLHPSPLAVIRYGPDVQGNASTLRLVYDFVIDREGRVGTIRRRSQPAPPYYVNAGDVAPALAASRFPQGVPRTGCSVTFAATATRIDSAPQALLYEVASRPETPGTIEQLMERVRPAGSTCPSEPGQYRRLNMPAFERIRSTPGQVSWVFLSFDVDRAGASRNVRILGTSGNEELDAAGSQAVLHNRYEPGPGYVGCVYHFHRVEAADERPPTLPADLPDGDVAQPGCSIDPRSITSLLDGRAYPTPFARRRIKGVAVLTYDTAPWGAVGNVRVLASEPDESFGAAARAAFTSATVAEGPSGRRGCVQRIRFELPPAPA
jgi:TonB family protein